MKANKSLLFTLLLSMPFLLGSCADKDDENSNNKKGGARGTDDQSINEWIYDEMSFRYYWNDKMPSSSSLNYKLEPDNFFYSTLYKYKKADGDRFSYLEKDGIPHFANMAVSNKAKNDIGFEFQAYEDDKKRITLCVTYVKNGTRAKEQGLRRGDWITEVDNTPINESNFRSILYTGKPQYKLKFDNKPEFTLETTNNYAENPILKWDVLPLDDGRSVGYIVYNFFANDADDNSMRYALEMNSILKNFEGKISDLVLDLRYNGGGYVESGNYIASAIVPNRGEAGTTIYTKRAFNKKYDEAIRSQDDYEKRVHEFFHSHIMNGRSYEAIPRLNMQRLYVLTSQNTASASEQIINGLRAYISKVEVIGETTTGKNMESYDIKDSRNKENKWVLHALTSVSYNSKANRPEDNNYSTGFEPTKPRKGEETLEFTFYTDNTGNIKPNPIYELGDPKEPLLSVALNDIRGTQRGKRSLATPTSMVGMKPIGSSLDRKPNLMIIENQETN